MKDAKIKSNDLLAFISAFLFGLLAHGYMLTNNIPVNDDLRYMFTKGETTSSGRWGLELTRYILPDYPMPWLYGCLSIIIIAVTMCLVMRMFKIRNKALIVLLSGLFISFPAFTGTLAFIFTVTPYAISLFCAVFAVYYFQNGYKFKYVIAALLITFSSSIYQGYFGFAASFCVILMIQELLDEDNSAKQILIRGVKMFVMLVVSAAIYGASIVIISKISGIKVIDAVNTRQSLLLRIAVAYSAYLHTFTRGYFAYIHSNFSLAFHALLVICAAYMIIASMIKCRDIFRIAVLSVCLFLFPLSCYCLYVIADSGYIHSLALYPFASLYVLLAVIFDKHIPETINFKSALCLVSLLCIILSNVFFANEYSLREYMLFENQKYFYSVIMSNVLQKTTIDDSTVIAIVGDRSDIQYDVSGEFDFSQFIVPGGDIMVSIDAGSLAKYYLGWNVKFADEFECAYLAGTEAYQQMPLYPNEGSIDMIDGFVVVKLK